MSEPVRECVKCGNDINFDVQYRLAFVTGEMVLRVECLRCGNVTEEVPLDKRDNS